jgi:ribose transport system permease protein
MPPERTDIRHKVGNGLASRLHGLGPLAGLVALCLIASFLNPEFATLDNALNVLTRTTFTGIIAVGMCFVIVGGGIDLSVGSMAALIAGCVILLMNTLGAQGMPPGLAVLAGASGAVLLGSGWGWRMAG